MLAKRKFQNFVGTYGDQSISGKKTFTENLVVTGECTLPDDTNLNITFDNSSIAQSVIVSTSGWIYDTFTELIGSVTDLVSDLTNNTFGFLTTTDTISQNQIDQTTENGWITGMYTTMYDGLTNLLAPKTNPTFTGDMTFPNGKVISQTEEDTTFWKDVTLNGTVTFPESSISQSAIYWAEPGGWFTLFSEEIVALLNGTFTTPTFEGTVTFIDTSTTPNTSTTISDYLKSSTAASTYLTQTNATSTYAPKASPTFTGTISLNGNVTLASASANTITLNDHLVLCAGSNFTTPVSGQQGYIKTGTNTTDATAITSASSIDFASINLSYGVWLIIGHLSYFSNAAGTITDKYFWINSQATTQSTTNMIKNTYSISVGLNKSHVDSIQRIVTVTSASQDWFLGANLTFSTTTLITRSSNTNLYAVRIA